MFFSRRKPLRTRTICDIKIQYSFAYSKKKQYFCKRNVVKDMNAANDAIMPIYRAIREEGFSSHVLQQIDDYTNDILNGRTNFPQFNLQEHAGLCSADSVLIGAYTVACYARTSLATSGNASACKGNPTNWEIDARQEELVYQWAVAKKLWIPNSEQILIDTFGPKIAQGAEAKVYYKSGDGAVIKERTSIYSTLGKAFESIVLHNALFPETQMKVVGFTRDSDGLFRTILTQPYVECARLATKSEIDKMVAAKGFCDNGDGRGVNYIGERLYLEDMHPANVFIDKISEKPTCIDCIVKFR